LDPSFETLSRKSIEGERRKKFQALLRERRPQEGVVRKHKILGGILQEVLGGEKTETLSRKLGLGGPGTSHRNLE